ncbi:Sucrose synthase 1 [Hordeum vulgare]|nr:Sucrose synthase 1 [Hordeum vulgare]
MPGLVSFFLRLIREDGRRYRLIARRHHGVGGLRRFHRRMQAIRRFGRDAAGRGYHGTRRDARGGYYTSGSGLHAAGCAHRGAPRARGPTPMGFDPSLVAGPSAPAVHEDAAAPAPPPGSPPPPPPPPTAWMAPLTPTPAAETAGPSRGPPGYVPVPMRALVDEEPRHRWKRPWARAAARRGVSTDSSGAPSPPSTAVPAAALSRGPRRASDSPAPRQRLRARTPSSSDLLRKTRARRGCAGDHRSPKGMRRPLLPAGAAVWQWGSSRGGAGVQGILVIRPRPGVWEYVRVNVSELAVEELTVPEYLQFKEQLVEGSNKYFVLQLDFEPFNASFPRPSMSKSIGNGVQVLNMHLSSKLFHDNDFFLQRIHHNNSLVLEMSFFLVILKKRMH